MILLYHILSFILLPCYLIIIFIRLLIGKEDITRVGERFGFGKKRIYGASSDRLIWIHAASVGESMVVLTLLRNISKHYPTVKFLVTSWTNSSAKILKTKLPKNAIHQLLPIDNIIFVKRFFNNWQPDLGIFIESELWPSVISEGAKFCKLLLLNARMSDQSFKTWQACWASKDFFKLIIQNFSEIIVQSSRDLQKFNKFDAKNIVNLGNIKFANQKLEVSEQELSILSSCLKNKKVIIFASTHPEDEDIIFPILKNLKKQFTDCYFILIPRHPERVKSIIDNCRLHNLSVTSKSQNNLPILSDDLYIVDKFGEMGLFFSLACISFIGGSFKQGGHNILEAACFANCIIFGPDMSKNTDIAKEALQNEAAIQIKNGDELFARLQHLLSPNHQQELKNYQKSALKFVEQNQKILDQYLSIIKKYMEHKMMWLLSPALRWEIFATFKELANKELQLTKWVNPNKKYTFWSELLFCIETFFDDAYSLEKHTQIRVGLTMYNEEEVEKINKFCNFFYNLTEEIEDQEQDMAYFGHPQWQKIIDDAAELVEIMEQNNKAHNFDDCLAQSNQFSIEGYEDYDDFAEAENIKNGYKLW